MIHKGMKTKKQRKDTMRALKPRFAGNRQVTENRTLAVTEETIGPKSLQGALGRTDKAFAHSSGMNPLQGLQRVPRSFLEAVLGATQGHLGKAGKIETRAGVRKFVTKKANRFSGDKKESKFKPETIIINKKGQFVKGMMDKGYWIRVKQLTDRRR